jgi:hypothetical protein
MSIQMHRHALLCTISKVDRAQDSTAMQTLTKRGTPDLTLDGRHCWREFVHMRRRANCLPEVCRNPVEKYKKMDFWLPKELVTVSGSRNLRNGSTAPSVESLLAAGLDQSGVAGPRLLKRLSTSRKHVRVGAAPRELSWYGNPGKLVEKSKVKEA